MHLITAKQVSQALGVALPRVYELARLKLIPFVRLGPRQIRFDEDELRQWARSGGASEKVQIESNSDSMKVRDAE